MGNRGAFNRCYKVSQCIDYRSIASNTTPATQRSHTRQCYDFHHHAYQLHVCHNRHTAYHRGPIHILECHIS